MGEYARWCKTRALLGKAYQLEKHHSRHRQMVKNSLSVTAALLLGMVAMVHGHASVIMPPSRNAIDTEPGTPWSGGKHPATGWLMPYSADCTNGTEKCKSGQAAFWFSQGCTIGCKECTGNGSRIPNADHCPDLPKPPVNIFLLHRHKPSPRYTHWYNVHWRWCALGEPHPRSRVPHHQSEHHPGIKRGFLEVQSVAGSRAGTGN